MFFYVTDCYAVYPQFIDELDPIFTKPYMTRLEGENTRSRHYLARIQRQTLCDSKSVEILTPPIPNSNKPFGTSP
jgi:IS1 family transposase